MAKIKTIRFDAADHLKTPREMAALLSEALATGEGPIVNAALGAIARAKGMTALARETGLRREALYRALSADGNPEFETVMKVVKALKLELRAKAA